MAIKDRDGNVYKLRGPNPLMKEQSEWNSDNVKLINFGWEEDVKEDENNPIEQFKKDYDVVDIAEELGLKENVAEPVIEEPEKVEQEPEPEIESLEENKIDFDKKTMEFLQKNKVMVHCAPAIKTQIKDELYGDSYERITYGNKVKFAAVISKQTDFDIELWTTSEVSKESVIYPQDESKRWWKVTEVEPKSGGYLVSAITSDVNPDFS